MKKELRKRVWEERQKVYDLIDDIGEGQYIDEDEYYRRLQSVYDLLDDIVKDIMQGE